MIHIKYDTEGTFADGAFYDREIPLNIGIHEKLPDEQSGILFAGKTWVEYFRVEISKNYEPARKCSAKRAHVLEWCTKEVSADVTGGDEMGTFIDVSMWYIVMTDDFARQFREQKFRGGNIRPLKIHHNQSQVSDPALSYIEVKAPHCMREPEIVIDGSVACPLCGWQPLVCPACNYWERHCPRCQRDPYVETSKHEGPSDIRFKRDPQPPILDGRRWKGTDFMGEAPYAVSERVVQWLLATHAYPFIAKPLRFDITEMAPENSHAKGSRSEGGQRPLTLRGYRPVVAVAAS